MRKGFGLLLLALATMVAAGAASAGPLSPTARPDAVAAADKGLVQNVHRRHRYAYRHVYRRAYRVPYYGYYYSYRPRHYYAPYAYYYPAPAYYGYYAPRYYYRDRDWDDDDWDDDDD
jgi:hypothetical protein